VDTGLSDHSGLEGLWADHPDGTVPALEVIRTVKRGQGRHPDTLRAFSRAATDLVDQQADVLVLACTELSVIADEVEVSIPVVDTLQVLADDVVAAAVGS
jgi:aspartate racemase